MNFSFDFGGGPSSTGQLVQLIALLSILSLAPSILVMVTSFTRIIVVLSFLRSALGLQQTPPNAVLISLALFLTAFIMTPTLDQAYRDGIAPLIQNKITEEEAFERATQPVQKFMMNHVREQDLRLFSDIASQAKEQGDVSQSDASPADASKPSLRSLIPAFMISELRRAFEIGFLLFLPFLIIDLVGASVLMSMGMMMLPPVGVSLPFKLIFFVLVDGWSLVAGSLIQSYGGG